MSLLVGRPALAAIILGVAWTLQGCESNPPNPFPASTGNGVWQWVPIPGSKCIGGNETGVYIRYSSTGSRNVGIYLNGGGACFNKFTCHTCTTKAQEHEPGVNGIFSTDTKNPLKDFNWINVPYCTGDVHLGAAAKEFDGEFRYFNGRANLALIMKRAVATFPHVDTLFVTGESAGGFGAIASYDFMRGHWSSANGNANVRGVLVDDSGPILDDTAIPVCLQELWRTTWNLNPALPEGCPCASSSGNIGSVWDFSRKLWPKDSFGLISSTDDVIISTFFSFSEFDCHMPIPVGYRKLEAGLRRLSDSGVPVYMIPGRSHTHTTSEEFFTRDVSNASLYEWVGKLLSVDHDPKSVMPASLSATSEVSVVV